jgi:hypothetical protein
MEVATAFSGLGRCLLLKGDMPRAIKAYEKSWKTIDTLKDEPRGHRVGFTLVETYFAHGDLNRAFELIDQIEEKLDAGVAPVESRIDCLFLRGWLHYQLENYELSAELCQQSMKLAREHFGERDVKFGWPCGYVALSLEAQPNQRGAAARQYRRLLPLTKLYVENMSPRHDHDIAHWFHVRALLGSVQRDDSRLRDALTIAETGLHLAQETGWSCKEPAYRQLSAELQLRLQDQGRQAAIESLECGLAKACEPHATYRSSRWQLPTTRSELERTLAALHLEDGRTERAKQVLVDGVQIRSNVLGEHHIQVAQAQLRLGEFLVAQSEHAAAERTLLAAHDTLNPHSHVADHLRRRAATKLAELHVAIDQPKGAAEWQAQNE